MTVTPTLAILQIVTNTPTVSATGTAIPTGQLSPQVIPTLNAFCRKGPGTLYDQVTVLQDGTAYTVIGRDSLNTWWEIQLPGSQSCWVVIDRWETGRGSTRARSSRGCPCPERLQSSLTICV